MRVALTGATGFIGAPARRWLEARGHTVLPLPFSTPGDEGARLRDLRPDALIHAGWYVHPREYLHSPRNSDCLRRSLLLIEAAAEMQIALVTVGSCLEYGPTDAIRTEDLPCDPVSLYATCKLTLARVAPHLLPRAAHARPFHLYGPGEHPDRLLPSLARRLRAGEPIRMGPGSQRRDWLHVADVAAGIGTTAEAAAAGFSGIVNVCSGDPRTVADFASLTARLLGRPDLLHLGALPMPPGEEPAILGDNRRLLGLGWRPGYSLEEGIAASM